MQKHPIQCLCAECVFEMCTRPVRITDCAAPRSFEIVHNGCLRCAEVLGVLKVGMLRVGVRAEWLGL